MISECKTARSDILSEACPQWRQVAAAVTVESQKCEAASEKIKEKTKELCASKGAHILMDISQIRKSIVVIDKDDDITDVVIQKANAEWVPLAVSDGTDTGK